MLAVAFKEWAVVCRALAEGRQALILRKGGIVRRGRRLPAGAPSFLALPQLLPRTPVGRSAGDAPLLDAAEADRPAAGTVRLSHFADVAAVHFLDNLETARRLAPLHGWTDDVVGQRFHYRTPGLYVLVVRVSAVPTSFDTVERPEYAGCKTWVPLDHGLATDGANPVMDDAAFAAYVACVNEVVSNK